MEKSILIGDLTSSEGKKKLAGDIKDVLRESTIIYTTTTPNGSLSTKRGKIALYDNSGTYTFWMNVDGGTTWQQIVSPAEILWETDGGDVELKTADDIDIQNMQLKGMRIEYRTDDTGCTQEGRIWYRTDL